MSLPKMMLFLTLAISHAEKCVYRKKYSDDQCTNPISEPAQFPYKVLNNQCVPQPTAPGADQLYQNATCDADGTNLSVKRSCDDSTCGSCIVEYTDSNNPCEEDNTEVNTWVQYVCEDCTSLGCDMDLVDGTDANPNCTISTGPPIEGEHCIVEMYYSDDSCQTRSDDDYYKEVNVFDSTCQASLAGMNYHSKGFCTMDADGNLVSGKVWRMCDSADCNSGASCPSEGLDIVGMADCTRDDNAASGPAYKKYLCVKCDELSNYCPARYAFGSSVAACSSANALMTLMFVIIVIFMF